MKQIKNIPKESIRPPSAWYRIDFSELWSYREALYFLVWRDLKVRYKQTFIGAAWAIVQPLLTMIVFSVLFNRLTKISTGDIPYPIFVYIGLLVWGYFSNTAVEASASIVTNANFIRKIYFPRLFIPLASSIAYMIDYLISFVLLLGLMMYYHIPFHMNVLFVIPLTVLMFLVTSGVGFWFSGINAIYRDIRFIVPFFMRLGMFITPVIYPVTFIGEKWRWLLYLNPLTGLIESYRLAVLGYEAIAIGSFLLTCMIAVIVFVSGVLFFCRAEQTFVDIV